VCLLLYSANSIAVTGGLLESCLEGSRSQAWGSCERYIKEGGTSTAAYVRLAKLSKEKGDFETAKRLYERALQLGAGPGVSAKAKTTESLIEEQQWLDNNRSTTDAGVTASRADRIKCIRFSKIKPDIAHEACTRYLNSGGKSDPEVEKADKLAKIALGIAEVAEPAPTPALAPAPAPAPIRIVPRSLVKQSQLYLTRLGFNPGPVDGHLGTRTSDAIRSYQRINGLWVTGEPDVELMEHMRVQLARREETVASANPNPPSSTPERPGAGSTTQIDESVSDDLVEIRQQIAELVKLIKAGQSTPAKEQTVSGKVYVEQGERKALVIGNWEYPGSLGRLRNPGNDAKTVSSALEFLGFEVTTILNGSLGSMEIGVRNFSRGVKAQDTVLFYYAGHGVQIQGANYLIPTGVDIEDAIDIKYKSLDLSYIMEKVSKNIRGMTIVILDACRNNPFVSDNGPVRKGWAETKGPLGTLIAYATAPGEVAIDGSGDNGLYTKNLVRRMKEPGLRIEDMFKKVRVAVEKESRGKQIPWENSSLVGDFFFVLPNS